MTIESILTEWRYRLKKGYPDQPSDYNILSNILVEQGIDRTEADQIAYRAQGLVPMQTESVEVGTIENPLLLQIIQQENKLNEFTQFLKSLPADADTIIIQLLNSFDESESIAFARILYSYSEISENVLNTIDFRSGFLAKLFKLEPKGLGKGELLLAILFENSKINGAGSSYDMDQNGRPYEIKDYTGGTAKFASIRLGTKGSVTQFGFWDEIVTTLKRIDQLRGTIDNPKFDFHQIFHDELITAIDYLDNRKTFILAGNLNFKDKKMLQIFYREANTLNSDIEGFTNIILRGPNATPLELSIDTIKTHDDGTIVIKPADNDNQSLTYVNAELRRLKYVREPDLLDSDLQEAVDTITKGDLQLIVFRKDRVRITNEFRFVVCDAGRIRIIEKAIGTDVDLTEEINEEEEW